jgi:Domain of unknown function (DUF5127)
MVCPRACRRPDLFIPRGCGSEYPQWYSEPHRYYGYPYTDRGNWKGWTHASQSHVPKSYRGSYLIFGYFQCLYTHHLKPGDWVKQSIPFSYLAFTANSLDGASHAVQVYSDVSGGTSIVLRSPSFLFSFVSEWNSGDRTKMILWSPSSTADVVFHSVTLQTPAEFTEIIDQAEWGTLYYAMLAVS